jgi:hypothetical protein
VVADVHRRTESRPVHLTSDAYPVYRDAILHVYGEEVEETATGRAARRISRWARGLTNPSSPRRSSRSWACRPQCRQVK